MSGDKIKVLVVDDSALVRKIITDALHRDPEIEVIGTANNGKTAVFKTHSLEPDVITMDIEMPIMNGLDALREIIATKPKPVIMMSVLTQHGAEATFKALEYGAVDFVPKPSTVVSLSVDDISVLLVEKVKSAYKSKVRVSDTFKRESGVQQAVSPVLQKAEPLFLRSTSTTKKVVGIGTSTGGPSALITVCSAFPENFPLPVLIVQHMPEGFTKAFAERLNGSSTLTIKEAENGDKVLPGCGYVAPGHSHMAVVHSHGGDTLRIYNAEKVSGHRPSIDVMFDSLASTYGKDIIATIMTGMGRDGASGISKIHSQGGHTIAQDEETSVVFGMNRVAVELGGIDEIVPLQDITKKIVEHL